MKQHTHKQAYKMTEIHRHNNNNKNATKRIMKEETTSVTIGSLLGLKAKFKNNNVENEQLSKTN